MTADYPNAGYDEWLKALRDGDGYYLECPKGHGSLPPRRVCPHCADDDLSREALPQVGEVATYTVTEVAAPSFAEDVPYVTAVVDFGPVMLTGQVTELAHEDVEIGTTVEADVGERETTGDPILVFRPR